MIQRTELFEDICSKDFLVRGCVYLLKGFLPFYETFVLLAFFFRRAWLSRPARRCDSKDCRALWSQSGAVGIRGGWLKSCLGHAQLRFPWRVPGLRGGTIPDPRYL